ncbi:MAG: hypothetical protein CME71_10540 [Halobacteriovorax sp.]|nr:hypothetical protein [Halobacteriovorax sp.]
MSQQKLNVKTSQLILKDAVSTWAIKKKIEDLLVFESFDLPTMAQLERTRNVVFFGDFLASYAYFQENNIADKTIYVLCQRAKELLQAVSPKVKNIIEVINRYELFPVEVTEKSLPSFTHDQFDFVYAGRISRSKNMMGVLNLVKEMQKINPKVGLKLIGEFDPFLNISSEIKPYQYSIKKEVIDFIENNEWSKRPVIIQDPRSSSWLEQLDSSDIMLSLSSYWMEDFSVSLAQAQQRGFPLVVSDIGGHSDLEGENLIKIPYHLIGQNFFTYDAEMEQAQATCCLNYLLSGERGKFGNRNVERIDLPKFEQILELNAFDFFKSSEGRSVFLNYEKAWKASGASTKKILFLKTKEQNHWSSLVKISDQIQKFWIEQQTVDTELIVIDVDQPLDKSRLFKYLPECEYIIAQALAENTINVLRLIRHKFKSTAPIIAYPHELPSIFYASLKLRGLEDFFQEQDVFVVHCQADYEMTKQSFEQVNVIKVSAGFMTTNSRKQVESYKPRDLYYIGRISEQKNIHTLLWAISLIKDELLTRGSKLHLYGHHDHFGSPNFGISGDAYLDYLGDLVSLLEIEDLVIFHGHKAIEHWAEHIAKKKGLGVFPGIHVDENFGYAPFDLLKQGVPSVLTRWGGYKDLIDTFPHNTFPVRVIQTNLGPSVNPSELSIAILKGLSLDSKPNNEEVFYKITRGTWGESFRGSLKKALTGESRLKFTPLASELMSDLKYSPHASLKARGWMLNGHIFTDYSDQRFVVASEVYGALKESECTQEQSLIAPWVKKDGDEFVIVDPLKGEYRLSDTAQLEAYGFSFSNYLLKS